MLILDSASLSGRLEGERAFQVSKYTPNSRHRRSSRLLTILVMFLDNNSP